MTKIYLVRGSANNRLILEVELIKQTAEQLRVDTEDIKVVWKSPFTSYMPHVSNRLQRHREKYFTTLMPAIEYTVELLKKDREYSMQNVKNAEDSLLSLSSFAYVQKEDSNAN